MIERLKMASGVSATRATIAGFAFAALLTAAGCSSRPDQSVVTSSVTNELGYSVQSKAMAQAKPAATQRVVRLARTTYLGRAPYICTPSGFGSTSRCFLR